MTKYEALKHDALAAFADYQDTHETIEYYEFHIALARLDGFVEAGTLSAAERADYAAMSSTFAAVAI